MRDRAKRLIAACRHIATMSEEPGRITRRFLTPPVREVHAYLRLNMEALGMEVRLDAAGNLRGLWKPASAGHGRLIMGSHIDTVPDAGAFDGVLGVTMALEWVRLAREIAFPVPIEVIAFSEEEGVRFGVPFIGSRAVAGRFDPSLLALKDGEGLALAEAIRQFGLDPGKIEEAAGHMEGGDEGGEEGAAFVEIHIEQGPVLETEHRSVGVVTGIVGQTRLSLEFTGQANHAGTTPMHLRRDALAAAAEWIVFVEAFARGIDGLVATVGKVALEPNVSNVIPGKARVSLDVRHAHDSQRNSAAEELISKARAIAEQRSLAFDCTPLMNEPAVSMDERLTAYLAAAVEAAGLPLKEMPSGAGHDAMVMATRMPAAMLFLRSPGGISHHPDETVAEEDVEAALQVGRKFLERLASDWQA
jgi:allantoate deiminase